MKAVLSLALAVALSATAHAATVKADLAMATLDGPGASVGSVTISGGDAGAVLITDLHGLPPGLHGLHIHAGSSCAPGPDKTGKIIPAGAAMGHFDPTATGVHEGPDGQGHLGDLPVLNVADDGTARLRLLAPRIKDVDHLKGHALMIHVGGDNYSDTPAPLGGGGVRLACGVIQ
jgi:Cu-Zn family superoxide dismutase